MTCAADPARRRGPARRKAAGPGGDPVRGREARRGPGDLGFLPAADRLLPGTDRPATSSGPMEGINGRLEHLRGSALGFRNLAGYIARSLLAAGGFRPRTHPQL